jgi:hypothetical protein
VPWPLHRHRLSRLDWSVRFLAAQVIDAMQDVAVEPIFLGSPWPVVALRSGQHVELIPAQIQGLTDVLS